MKLNQIKNALELTNEGIYTAKIIGVTKADPISGTQSNIINVTLEELNNAPKKIFVSTKRETPQDFSIWDRTVLDIFRQLNMLDADIDTDDIESVNAYVKGKSVVAYCVHNQSADGKTYANFYFSKNNKVQAMLAFQ